MGHFKLLALIILLSLLIIGINEGANVLDGNEESTNLTSQNRPYFNAIEAGRIFANISAVLAGFAFASIFLLFQKTELFKCDLKNPDCVEKYIPLALLLAFFGFVSAALIFGIITGEEIMTVFTLHEDFLASYLFVMSFDFMFWGLILLIRNVLKGQREDITSFGTKIFLGWGSVGILLLIITWFDPVIQFQQNIPFFTGSGILFLLLSLAYIPIVLGYFLSSIIYNKIRPLLSSLFKFSFSLILIILILPFIGGVFDIFNYNTNIFLIPFNAGLILILSLIFTHLTMMLMKPQSSSDNQQIDAKNETEQ